MINKFETDLISNIVNEMAVQDPSDRVAYINLLIMKGINPHTDKDSREIIIKLLAYIKILYTDEYNKSSKVLMERLLDNGSL